MSFDCGRMLRALVIVITTVWLVAQTVALPVAHVIAHSHCDPGWLETYETYFRNDVSRILTNVFAELKKNTNRKFVWSETSFFSMWFDPLPAAEKEEFAALVRSGRIEFVGGGWVQNDEACPHYSDMIDQTTVGHDYLYQRFGVVPRFGWQIDPFGHSAVTPSLFRLIGYDAVVINRIHYQFKAALKARKNMEFLWRGTSLGGNTDLFTHVLHTHYSSPPGFDWESGSMEVTETNIDQMSSDLARILLDRIDAYRSPNLLVPFGDDFKYVDAASQFRNIDRLIKHINAHPEKFKLRLQYSTLADYFTAVASAASEVPTLQGDFFPYADNGDSFWTGYYTTRPFLKRISRTVSSALRAAEISYAIGRVKLGPSLAPGADAFDQLVIARQSAALFLHHDAITGTARGNVVRDYMTRMKSARSSSIGIVHRVMAPLLFIDSNITSNTLLRTPTSSLGVQPLAIFNSLSWRRKELICTIVTTPFAAVVDSKGDKVDAQINAHWNDPADPESLTYRLCFVGELAPLGVTTFFIEVADSYRSLVATTAAERVKVVVFTEARNARPPVTSDDWEEFPLGDDVAARRKLELTNDMFRVQINRDTGMMESITDIASNRTTMIQQRLMEYATTRSGAYLFRAEGAAEPLAGIQDRTPAIRVVHGPITSAAFVNIGSVDIEYEMSRSASLVLGRRIEIRTALTASSNREVVIRFDSDIDTKSTFYSNNGAEFVRRRYNTERTISANYYPSVSGARIEDRDRRLSVLTAHTSGVTSLSSGNLEFMAHRQLSQDDGRGLAEPIIDFSKAKINMRLLLEQSQTALPESSHRRQMIALDNPPVLMYATSTKRRTVQGWMAEIRDVHLFDSPIPAHMHLLSMSAHDAVSDDVIMRFENLKEPQEAASPTRIDLTRLFKVSANADDIHVDHVRETTLSTVYEFPLSEYATDDYLQTQSALKFVASGKTIIISEGGEELTADQIKQGNQNAEEDGVFISDVAVEKANQAAESGAVRRLLAWGETFAVPVAARQIRTFLVSISGSSSVIIQDALDALQRTVSPVIGGPRLVIFHQPPIELSPKSSLIVFPVLVCLGTLIAVVVALRSSLGSRGWSMINKDERHVV